MVESGERDRVPTSDEVVAASLDRASLPDAAACEALALSLGGLAVVDLETTGLDPSTAKVVEIGAVVLRPGLPARAFHRFVDPREPLPTFASRLTGLVDRDLAGAPSWQAASRDLAREISGLPVVAHNAGFERGFLGGLLPAGTPFLDSLELACVLHPEFPSHSMEALARRFFGRVERHRALDDAIDTLWLLAAFREELSRGEHEELLLGQALDPRWAWTTWLRTVYAGGRGFRLRPEHPGPRERARGTEHRAPAGRGAVPGEWLTREFVRELLGDEERWRRVFPGYHAREGQIDLACAILDAFASDRAFAAEAGTGIGKTLAYGLVATLHAVHRGERVVVSSANRTLQERLVDEELPRIAAVLGISPPAALVLRGRSNYGSPRRMRGLVADPDAYGLPLSAAGRAYVASWLARCADRDLQGFGGWLGGQDRALRAARDRVACDLDCDEDRCRDAEGGACAYLRRVDELRHASIVSINHALLLKWPQRYGPIERLVIDEAHELANEADRSFSEEVAAREMRGWLRRLEGGSGRTGMIAALAIDEAGVDVARRAAALARENALAIEEVGRALAVVAASGEVAVPSRAPEGDARWQPASEGLARVSRGAVALGESVEELLAVYRRCRGGDVDDVLATEAAFLATSLAAAGRGLVGDVFEQSRPDTVYAVRAFRRGEAHEWWLRATPLETAPLVHAKLLDPANTVVAVSATLGVGDDPGPSLQKIGWHDLERVRRLPPMVVPSPFDFRRRSVLAMVRGDGWRRAGFAQRCARAIADVASLLGGRTLGLFTSRQRLAETATRLEPLLAALGIDLLVHDRPGGAARLVDRFASDPRAVLLGTRSLWQGVDVPGEALSCVVIDKLPFPRPEDPLLVGRSARLRENGGDPFRVLSLEPAVIGFKQMFGRLIRSESDRGFVVVLGADPAKGYIEDFVRSLPGPPRFLVGEWREILEDLRAFFPGEEASRDGGD
jgi:Rad3-related DNA helicase